MNKNRLSLNRNGLKIIAIIAMLTDHIAMFFVPTSTALGFCMRTVGRLTAPIMCMFLAEGYFYTSSKRNYGLRLLIFGVVSQPIYAVAHGNPLYFPDFNMILTLLLCFLLLLSYDKIKNGALKTAAIVLLTAASAFCDWGIIAPMWTLGFFVFRQDSRKKTLCYCLISAVHALSNIGFGLYYGGSRYSQLWQLGVFLFLPLMMSYNGKSGKKNAFAKYFFYAFYPLHLLALVFCTN